MTITIGACSEAEYGLEFDAQDEDYNSSDLKRRMHMLTSRHPIEPLTKGRWE